jgi:hypothetical protein
MIKNDESHPGLESALVGAGLVIIMGLICFLARVSKKRLDSMIEGNEPKNFPPREQQYGSFE